MTHNLKDRIRRALTPIRGNARAFLSAVLVVAFAAACDVHGISDPGILVSITDAIGAIIVAACGCIWWILSLIVALPAILKTLRARA